MEDQKDPASSQTKINLKKTITPVVFALVLFGAVGYGMYAWQAEKIADLKEQLSVKEAEISELREGGESLLDLIVARQGAKDTDDEEETRSGLAVQETPLKLYRDIMRNSRLNNQEKSLVAVAASYLTDQALEEMQEPRPYSLLLCNQGQRNYFYMGSPVIDNDRAQMSVYTGHPGSEQDEIQLELIKQDGKWLIDSIVCEAPEVEE